MINVNSFPQVNTLEYTSLRQQIHSGDLLLCSGSSVFSKLIQNATQSVWSHVGFIIRLENIGRIMILESVESIGVRTVPLSSYISNYNGTGKGYPGKILIARHHGFHANEINNLSKHAVDLLGYPYNSQEIARIAARIALNAFSTNSVSKNNVAQNEFICSEYVYTCYKSIGIEIKYNTAGFIAPADFARDPQVEPIAFVRLNSPVLENTQIEEAVGINAS